MTDSYVFSRRDFLRLAGIGVAGAAAGCAKGPAEKAIPYLVPPENILPGVPYWYASTCRECAAGCGILVKTREGRAIKIEGNPAHPLSRGGLCARGQAALQGLYDADRVRSPMVKEGGAWKAVSWDQALALASDRIGQAVRERREVALITEHATGSFEKLSARWAAAAGGTHLVYEPFDYQALREANRRTFGQATIPHYDFAAARFLISFGADFLETWGAPVVQSRAFAEMRARQDGGLFVSVEPRLSMTGANADEWVAIRPGGEMALALGMVNVILADGLGASGAGGAADAVSAYTPEAVQSQTDVPAETVRRLARLFAAGQPSLAVAGSIATQSEQAVAMIGAVNLLNYVAGNLGRTIRFDRALNYDSVASLNEVQRLASRMNDGGVGVLVVHGANPVYAVPPWAGFTAAMDRVPFKISLSSVLDETADRCDLILPGTHSLESLGDAESARGVYSTVQPVMQRLPMFDARPAGDTLITLAQRGGFGAGFPASWTEFVSAEWRALQPRFGGGADFQTFWNRTLQQGGAWEETPAATGANWASTPAFAAPELRGSGTFALVVYPSMALYDGRGANKSWLQELPDPTTKVVWGSWVEIHPDTAEKLGIAMGDPVKIETEAGSIELPAYLYAGIRKDTIAVPLGQGHTAYGRYAKGRGVNPLALLPPAQDAASGSVAYLSARAKVSKGAKAERLYMTQREKQQADREVAQIIPLATLMGAGVASGGHSAAGTSHAGAAAHGGAAHHPALPSQTRPGRDTEPRQLEPGEKIPTHSVSPAVPEMAVRGPRRIPVSEGSYAQGRRRWGMSIDLNSCTGCSACVVACQSENNIPTVGPDMVQRGREMHWLRIERFEERMGSNNDVRFLPMLCQHCTDAPCETVCPVYATYHNPEGLNAQVYNRCVGTRYCSNNCPYKVRAFNFFDYSAPEKATFAFPEPLNWQLNPDVTVRSKGVMEKCTFCVQRILEGKGNARDQDRPLADLEIQTACQQSCPTQAIVFGDLMDPESQVSRLSKQGERRYWALNDLNTKPAITYLKKIARESETA